MRIIITLLLLISHAALANDRAALVQARLTTALGNIIQRSDFLVVVNRVDQLEDGGQNEVISGTVKALPGLNVGVDGKGQIVRQDADSTQYNGPIVITLLVDKSVQEETYTTIKQMLPEISGGLRDLDEYKVRRATLRQVNAPDTNAPVNVNNIMPNKQENQWSDSLKFFAILLLTAGMFAWLLSRVLPTKESGAQTNRLANGTPSSSLPTDSKEEKLDWDFDPPVVGLYLLKCMKEKKIAPIYTWVKTSSTQHQRKVLKSLPAWMASYFQSMLDSKNFFEEITAEPSDSVFREITILEQNLTKPQAKELAFLQWFPAPGLRHVPKQFQKSFSPESKKTLWSLRPDLGEFVNVGNINLEDLKEASESALTHCYAELASWPSTVVIKNKEENQDIVRLLVAQLEQIYEFGPLQAQIERAQKSLSVDDFTRLMNSTTSIETPLTWDQSRRRDWLRTVEPQDYFWWLSLLKTKPSWNLDDELRPMRKAMFRFAEMNPNFESWSENDKKAASARMLQQLRSIQRGEDATTTVLAA